MIWEIGALLGFAVVIVSSVVLVEGSKRLSDYLGLEHYVFGAISLSALVVLPIAIEAHLSDTDTMTDLVVGNAMGVVMLGLCILLILRTHEDKRFDIHRDMYIIALAAIILPILGALSYLGFAEAMGMVAAIELLLLIMYVIRRSESGAAPLLRTRVRLTLPQIALATAVFMGALAAFYVGYDLISDNLLDGINSMVSDVTSRTSSSISSDRLVELFSKGIAVSLSEVILGFVASFRGEKDMAVGIGLGSIFLGSLFSCLGVIFFPLTAY